MTAYFYRIRAYNGSGDSSYTAVAEASTKWSGSPPLSGMIAWWPGENSSDDIMGSHNGTTPYGIAYAPGESGQAAPAPASPLDLPSAQLDEILGVKGKATGGVYQFSVPRRDPITESGTNVPGAMGSANAVNFQPTGQGKAAITGDFVVTADEVNPLIRALRAEGHSIDVGCLGENFTLTGVPWEKMVPGATLEVGEVQIELTRHAAPCNNLRPYFVGGKFVRVAQKAHPGWSRLYARVLREGTAASSKFMGCCCL